MTGEPASDIVSAGVESISLVNMASQGNRVEYQAAGLRGPLNKGRVLLKSIFS